MEIHRYSIGRGIFVCCLLRPEYIGPTFNQANVNNMNLKGYRDIVLSSSTVKLYQWMGWILAYRASPKVHARVVNTTEWMAIRSTP